MNQLDLLLNELKETWDFTPEQLYDIREAMIRFSLIVAKDALEMPTNDIDR